MYCAIDATDIVMNFGDVKALDRVSLRVNEGEIFGFLGPNGAGKSTFVKIILDLITPSQGVARIFGKPSKSFYSRKNVGFLPENIVPYKFLTVEEFIKFHAELSEIPGDRINKEINNCIDALGLGEKRKKKLGTLSKGLMQKVGIAQAVLGRPKLLFLDEPTSGLDPIAIRELRRLLLEMKNRGTTIFLNSHFLSEVERTCDRIAILNKGKVIKTGSQSDLSTQKKYLEVVADGFTDAMAFEINKFCSRPGERNGNVLRFFPENVNDSVSIHRIIIDHKGKLVSISWKGESLEEVFYRLIKDENIYNS
jgi:ABC-2 type transport system ATP-binding protein